MSIATEALTQRILRAVVAGMEYNPGHSDLDDEQPITVRMTLGDYRLACRLQVYGQHRVTFLWEDGTRKPYHWTEDGAAVGDGIFTKEAAERVAKACNEDEATAAAQVEQLINGEWRIV